jgi:hypothetical protein
VFILNVLKVCFDTLLQVFILKLLGEAQFCGRAATFGSGQGGVARRVEILSCARSRRERKSLILAAERVGFDTRAFCIDEKRNELLEEGFIS